MFNTFHHSRDRGEEAEQKHLTSRAYNRWSHVWNLARFTNGTIYQTTLQHLDDRHQSILDVGCGTGLMSVKLAASGRRVCGVDISSEMVKRARRRGDSAIKFIQGDAENLPPEIGVFDAVVNLISFHHYPNPSRAVAEFRRVLRPGGRLILVAFDRNSRYIKLAQKSNCWTKAVAGQSWQKTSNEVIALVRAAGFSQVEVTRVCYWIKTFAIVAE
jgi:ubiquinone/menaquinone biosynthesis C-methylase UbiE